MDNKTIRVLHIIRKMNVGGAETLIMNIYRNINREKIQFDFLVNEEGYFDDEIKKLGGNIFYIPYITDVGQTLYKKKLTIFFNKHKEYNIIHSHLDQVSGIIVETAKRCNVPVRISHSHNINNSNNIIVKIYKIYLQSKINKNATHFFACSNDAAKWLFKEKSNNAIIINNGIDIEKFKFSIKKREKIREEIGIDQQATIIGNIGRFSKQKNHKFLIDIFFEYQKHNPNSFLVLVGKGKLENKIKEKVRKMNIENKVKFLGIREDTDSLYSAFDFFVFPSIFEGLGITLIEAQASGLKTIASADVIPIETKLTDLIKYISLKEKAEVWAKQIKKSNDINRININDSLINSKYNIKYITKYLQNFYEEVI